MAQRLTQAAYARRRGLTRQAVHYALKVGRIHVGEDGLLDVRATDRAWAANTGPIHGGHRAGAGRPPRGGRKKAAAAPAPASPPRARRTRVNGASPVPAAQPRLEEPAVAPPAAAGEDVPPPGHGLISAKTMREEWAGKLAELNYRERAGELLDRAETLRTIEDVHRGLRDALFGIPARLANVVAAETRPVEVRVLLEDEIVKSLEGVVRMLEGLAPDTAEAAS